MQFMKKTVFVRTIINRYVGLYKIYYTGITNLWYDSLI